MGGLIPIWRRNLCAVTGAIAGAFVGTVFGLLLVGAATPTLTQAELLQIALILAVVAWLCLLVLLASWLHYQLSVIWLPALVNAVITAILTVLLAYALKHFPYLAPIIGAIVGTLVGAVLCRFCEPQTKAVAK